MADIHDYVSAKAKARMDAEAKKLDAGTLLTTSKGVIRPCEHNAAVLISGAPQFNGLHYDEFLSRIRIDERDWADVDDLDTACWLQWAHGVARFSVGQARAGVRCVANLRRRDSLRIFVELLPSWDGTTRIDMAFVDAWGAEDTELIRAASRNFFVALIARAMRPGAQVDTLWTFEGPQGIYKSRALRSLGGDFHTEITAAVGTADFMRELRGVWIAELSELDSLRGREASTIKRLLSATGDRFVQKYALHAENYPRRAICVATTNEAQYWQDSTGARRLIPITCADIRLDIIEGNRLQWFAEARHRYTGGATWWEFPAAMDEEQEARQQVDAWEDVLRKMITDGRKAESMDGQGVIAWPDGPIRSSEIMGDWLGLQPHQMGWNVGPRLGRVMRRLGFKPARIGRGRDRGWIR